MRGRECVVLIVFHRFRLIPSNMLLLKVIYVHYSCTCTRVVPDVLSMNAFPWSQKLETSVQYAQAFNMTTHAEIMSVPVLVLKILNSFWAYPTKSGILCITMCFRHTWNNKIFLWAQPIFNARLYNIRVYHVWSMYGCSPSCVTRLATKHLNFAVF